MCARCPPDPSALHAEQSLLSHPLLTGEVLHSLHHLCDPLLDNSLGPSKDPRLGSLCCRVFQNFLSRTRVPKFPYCSYAVLHLTRALPHGIKAPNIWCAIMFQSPWIDKSHTSDTQTVIIPRVPAKYLGIYGW